ncbi:MAG TPA: hypothetical protein VGC18_06460 [Lacisediminihabitans sp.]|uniref:oxidoreductase n=1 Tax=Lacisediminihabitans sp. TaxID=2787631 RepID=UPI002ED999A6
MTTADDLLAPLTFPCGAVAPNRIAQAPMVVWASEPLSGHVTDADVEYFARRADVAGMIITGASFVNREGRAFLGGLGIDDATDMAGLRRLAAAIKSKGNLALVQLHHGGREAKCAYDELGYVLAPSAIDLPFLPYVPREMTEEQIASTVADFGRAAVRAVEAGFDGVEIHGANHYLLQQFFSAYSNRRTDAWGGDLERRMAFPLAVLDEVKRAVAQTGKKDFIVGYRMCPDEIHGENVGYDVTEAMVLAENVAAHGADYVHLSIFTGYDAVPAGHDASYGRLARKAVAGRCPVVIVSNVFTADDAVTALDHGDIVAIGREAHIDPDFATKLREGHADQIITTVAGGRFTELCLPDGVRTSYTTDPWRHILQPMPGIEAYL